MSESKQLAENNFGRIDSAPEFMPEANHDEVARLAATLDVRSPKSILNFGHEVAEKTSSYSDALLEQARVSDLDEVGSQLSSIVTTAKSFNLSALDNRWSRTPLVGPLVKKFVLTRDKMISRFDSVKSQVETLVQNVETTTKTLEKRSDDFQAMYEGVHEELMSLSVHIAAIEQCLKKVDTEISESNTHAGDLHQQERAALLEASRNALRKRADDLQALQHSALQTLPMVRVMQANNVALIDKFQTIQKLTLPAWKRTFLMALTLEEQNDSVVLANSIDDATNEFMKRNADMLHQNSVATAKANQRLVVDVDTLKHVHEKVLQTLEDVRETHEQGAKERSAALEELKVLRAEMIGSIAKAKRLDNAPA